MVARTSRSTVDGMTSYPRFSRRLVISSSIIRGLWSSHPKLEDRIDNLHKELKKRKRKEKKNNIGPGVVPDPQEYYRGISPVLIMNARLDLRELQFARVW